MAASFGLATPRGVSGPTGGRARAFALAVAILMLVAACQGTNGGPGVSVQSSTVSASSRQPGAAGSAALAPTDRLVAAFSTLAAGYAFDSTVTLGSSVATRATGRWIGGSSEFVVQSSGSSITYRSVPPRSWILRPGADWVQVDAAPGGDPLDALAHPLTATVTGDGPEGLRLEADYGAADFGLTGSDPIAVTILLAPDGAITATYSTTTSAGAASSQVVLDSTPSQAPIAAPSASAAP